MIGILDYGIGNVSSIHNMLKKIGVASVIASSEEISDCNKLILPGVGHFDYCIKQLKAAPFFEVMMKKVIEEKTPLLGICVGCQMLFERSEEGNVPGLGLIEGEVIRFRTERMASELKVPHMAWTDVTVMNNNPLYEGIDEPRFYFVHSYHVSVDQVSQISAKATYGYDFAASVAKDNIMGVQFHPEKSHKFGMRLYENFASIV